MKNVKNAEKVDGLPFLNSLAKSKSRRKAFELAGRCYGSSRLDGSARKGEDGCHGSHRHRGSEAQTIQVKQTSVFLVRGSFNVIS